MTIYSIAKPASSETQPRVEFYLDDTDGDINFEARNLDTGETVLLAWKFPKASYFQYTNQELPRWLGLRQPSDGPLFE